MMGRESCAGTLAEVGVPVHGDLLVSIRSLLCSVISIQKADYKRLQVKKVA